MDSKHGGDQIKRKINLQNEPKPTDSLFFEKINSKPEIADV